MLSVRVTITRFVDDAQPGIAKCMLIDAQGWEWLFIEKVPIVALADLDADSIYPQPGEIACQIVHTRRSDDGREIVTVDTALTWGVQSISGDTIFEVLPDQLIMINDAER